jgi:hypothetical protein
MPFFGFGIVSFLLRDRVFDSSRQSDMTEDPSFEAVCAGKKLDRLGWGNSIKVRAQQGAWIDVQMNAHQ